MKDKNTTVIQWEIGDKIEVLKCDWMSVSLIGRDNLGNIYSACGETFISNPQVENITDIQIEETKPKLHTFLGFVVPPNEEVESGDLTLNGNFYEKYARMHRALINWRKGVNGKIDIKVNDENKEWLLALNEETNDLISYFDFVFGNNT